MCIALPMKILEAHEGWALCEGMGERRRIDLSLVGAQPVGAWVLVFLDAAREVVTEARAKDVENALTALNLALSGEADPASLDALFPDLANREPELPDFLKNNAQAAGSER